MENLIKEKEHSYQIAVVPLDAVPITSLLQIGIPTVAIRVGTSSSKVLPTSTIVDSIKLAQSMENTFIQGEEIKKLRQDVKTL